MTMNPDGNPDGTRDEAELTRVPLVLIVEDEANIAELVRFTLEDEGLRAEVAPDGARGVQLAEELQPDLVLLDVMLPLLTGEEVAKRLHEMPGGGPPIVLLSASADIGRLAVTLDTAGFIRKPFDLEQLIRIVDRTLAMARAEAGSEADEAEPISEHRRGPA